MLGFEKFVLGIILIVVLQACAIKNIDSVFFPLSKDGKTKLDYSRMHEVDRYLFITHIDNLSKDAGGTENSLYSIISVELQKKSLCESGFYLVKETMLRYENGRISVDVVCKA